MKIASPYKCPICGAYNKKVTQSLFEGRTIVFIFYCPKGHGRAVVTFGKRGTDVEWIIN